MACVSITRSVVESLQATDITVLKLKSGRLHEAVVSNVFEVPCVKFFHVLLAIFTWMTWSTCCGQNVDDDQYNREMEEVRDLLEKYWSRRQFA